MNVSSVVNHFSTANKGFITTLGSTISAGATTIPLTSVSGLTNGTIFVGIIEPGLANEQEFTGTVDTAGVQITGVKWTDGTNVDHTAGVTIVDYVAATDWNMNTKGILVEHGQTGAHSTTLITSRTEDTAPDPDEDYVLTYDASATALKKAKLSNLSGATDGWIRNVLPAQSGTIVANGNRSYDVPFASSVASILSPGMRIQTTRTVAAPTQCTSLNGTTQYWSKASPNKLTFTDDFVVSAWVKLSSYAEGMIVSRWDGTSGWFLDCLATGQIMLRATNAAAGNRSDVTSYQSIPLNKWVHVTAQLDMSAFTATTTTSYIMFDGKDVPASVSRGGTNPTALVQAGNLQIGAANGGTLFFPGKIAQVAIFNAKVTQATMLTYISQGLSGSETNLASAYSFNGVATDLNTTTPNDLSASGSAVATNADSPFGNAGTSSTLDYALVMSVSGSTATVQVAEGNTIPTSGGITSVAYSVQGNPFGWVSDKGRWTVETIIKSDGTQGTPTINTWYNLASTVLSIPTGIWGDYGYETFYGHSNSISAPTVFSTLSTANNSESNTMLTGRLYQSTNNSLLIGETTRRTSIALTAATPFYLNFKTDVSTATSSITMYATTAPTRVFAIPSGL